MKKIFHASRIVLIITLVFLIYFGFTNSIFANEYGSDISPTWTAQYQCAQSSTYWDMHSDSCSYNERTINNCWMSYPYDVPGGHASVQRYTLNNGLQYGGCQSPYVGDVLYQQDQDAGNLTYCAYTPFNYVADNCTLPATINIYSSCPAGTTWGSSTGNAGTDADSFTFMPSYNGTDVSVWINTVPSGWTAGSVTPLSQRVYQGGGAYGYTLSGCTPLTPPPVITSFGPAANLTSCGQTATISWTSTNATSCSGSWTGTSLPVNGSASGLGAGTYSLTCSGLGGTSAPSSVTITSSATGCGGTPASWSGWGTCSNNTQSGTCTEATGGNPTTCASLGYSAGTNTQSCGTSGSCGSSNGGTFSSAPTTNLCSAGTQSSVTGSGPWSWTCAGSGGGFIASCSANYSGGGGGAFDFGITSGTINIAKGSSGSETIPLTLSTGTAQPVTITASGLPANVTNTYTSQTCTPSCNPLVNLVVGASATVGTYPITVTGTAGSAGTPVQIILTSGTSWTVPSDWNNSSNKIEAIGGGGGGNNTSSYYATAGGGGGGYANISNLTLTSGNSVPITIGAGGVGVGCMGSCGSTTGGNTTFNGTSVGAGGGKPGNNIGYGTGGAGGNVLYGTGYSGGKGGSADTAGQNGGAGGGSASGPHRIGYDGSASSGVYSGYSDWADARFGGAGVGGGYGTAGIPGNPGTEWGTAGSGSGAAGPSGGLSVAGKNGGLYGGGGSGANKGSGQRGGSGAQGVIVITYTPNSTVTHATSFTLNVTGPMSGTLTPLNQTCTIAVGGNSCTQALTRTVTNPVVVGGSSVTSPTGTPSPSGGDSGTVTFTAPRNASGVNFYLYNNGVVLAQTHVSTSCAANSAWNGTTCAQYTVTPSAGANGTISPNTAQTVAYNTNRTFTVTPNSGYSASVAGTCGGSLVGTTYTTNAVTANCIVIANFAQMTGTLTPANPTCTIASGGNSCTQSLTWTTNNPVAISAVTSPTGTTSPGTSANNGTQTFTAPYNASGVNFYLYNNGIQLATTNVSTVCAANTAWNGSACTAGGTISGTLTPLNPTCTIAVGGNSCTQALTRTVTNPVVVGGSSVTSPTGTPSPSGGDSGTVTFTAPRNASGVNFYLYNNGVLLAQTNVSTSCAANSAWNGTTCAQYTVTPSAGANGTISPNTAQTVAYNTNRTFTVTPNSGYSASVAGTCGGSLVGTTYTTNAVTANCIVIANFAQMTGTLTPANPTCTIASGGNSCTQSLTWTTNNPVAISAVTSPTELRVRALPQTMELKPSPLHTTLPVLTSIFTTTAYNLPRQTSALFVPPTLLGMEAPVPPVAPCQAPLLHSIQLVPLLLVETVVPKH